MAGSSFSSRSHRVGSRHPRRGVRRSLVAASAALLLALGIGVAWAHPSEGWGHHGPSAAWAPEHHGYSSNDGSHGGAGSGPSGDHEGDHSLRPTDDFSCMVDPSVAGLRGAIQRTIQATVAGLRAQYGLLYNGLHYRYTITSVSSMASMPVEVKVHWNASVRDRRTGQRQGASGAGSADYTWQHCHWVQVGSPTYTADWTSP